MKHILNQAAALILSLLLLYGLALVIAVPTMSRPTGANLDTASAARSVFMTEPKYAFLNRSLLNTTGDKTILLGASNVLAGFRPAQMQGRVPATTVHNLAIGGSNMTEVGQMVDLVLEVQSPGARAHNVFVIGLWYGLFADDQARWFTADRHPGDTDLDIERYRYAFYRRTDSGPVPLLPPRWLDSGVTLITPFLLVDRLARDASKILRADRPLAATADRATLPDARRQQQYLTFWQDYMGASGRLGEQPFASLQQTIDSIVASGGRVLLVDLPLPRWHAEASPYDASYRQHLSAIRQGLEGVAAVSFLSLRDEDRPEDFSDEVHPRPDLAARWAARLADALNALPNGVATK